MNRILIFFCMFLSFNLIAEDKVGDQVHFVHEQDKVMNEAIAIARNQLDEFFSTAKNPPKGAKGFKLKVMVSDENGVEHLWFSPFRQVEGGYAGVLANQPNTITSMKHGEVYAFTHDQITDWGYVLNGKQIGSYTVCALFKSMDKTVVEQYKKDHGFECGS